MASLEELARALKNADAAGDTVAAQKLAQAYQKEKARVGQTAVGKRGGMVTEGTISREEYMRQRGPVNAAAPSAPDGSLIPMANQPVQTPMMKPVVSEDMLRPGVLGMNMAATSQALDGPQALRSEKMSVPQSVALGVNDLNPVRLATSDRGYEAAMTRSLEDNPISTRLGQTAALTAGGGAQLTGRAIAAAPRLVSPAVAARFAGSGLASQGIRFAGRGAVLGGTGVLDYYAYNALAEAPNQARAMGMESPSFGQRLDYANSQVFTPGGVVSAALPVAGSIIARGIRGGVAATKNLATTGSATTRTVAGGGTQKVQIANLFTPSSVQRSVANAGITQATPSARGRTARDEAIDLLLAKGLNADQTETLVKRLSYDRYTTVDEMLFELANADIDQLAVAAARVGGDAKKTFREAFKARNAEMPERIRTQLRDAMALSGDELEDFAAQMVARADEATADGYAAAYSQQVSDGTWASMWDRLSVSPDAADAIAAGARLARNSYRGNPAQLEVARQLEQLAGALGSPSTVPPKLSTHALDYLDRGFGSLIAGAKKSNPSFAASLIEIQKALRAAGLDADTGLSGPRGVYSQYKAAARAMDFGAKAFGRGTPLRDIKKQFSSSLKDADEVFEDIVGEGRSVVDQALIMGWLRGAEDAIETATNPGGLLRQIYGSERQRAKLLEMMPQETDVMTSGVKSDQTKRIKALVGSILGAEDYKFGFTLGSGARAEGRAAVPSLFERQRTMLENQGRVSGNSVTGDVTEAIANQGGLQRAANLIARTAFNPQEVASNAVLWAVQKVTTPAIFKPEVNRELGRILTTRGRDELLAVIDEIRARQAATGRGPRPPSGGSPTPSTPIAAGGFAGFGGRRPPAERTIDTVARDIKDIEKQLRRKGYTLDEAETLAEAGTLPAELRGLMIQHADLVRESGRLQDAGSRAAGGVLRNPQYQRLESELNKASDDIANAEYEIANELRQMGYKWDGEDAEFMGVIDTLRREGKLSNYLSSRVEDLRAASTRYFDAEAQMKAMARGTSANGLGLRTDLGAGVGGALFSGAMPMEEDATLQDRLQRAGTGFLLGYGASKGGRVGARMLGRNALAGETRTAGMPKTPQQAARFETPGSPEYEAAIAKGLDMSTPARKQRAQAAGYDTDQVLYHGTGKDFEAFDLGAESPWGQGNTAGGGIFLTSKPGVASEYAEGAAARIDGAGQVMPVYARARNPLVIDLRGRQVSDETVKSQIAQAKAAGNDAVILKNAKDSLKPPYEAEASDIHIIFDPANIRSVNAAFEPDKAASPILTAGLPGSRGPKPPTQALSLPTYKANPVKGQGFDEWLETLYSDAMRGPDNKTVLPNVFYRGMSDAEFEAAQKAGKFQSITNREGLYVEKDPTRYTGGGAYGAKRGGVIVQFDTTGLTPKTIRARTAGGFAEDGFDEIPNDKIARVWKWDPAKNDHVLVYEAGGERSLPPITPGGFAGGGSRGPKKPGKNELRNALSGTLQQPTAPLGKGAMNMMGSAEPRPPAQSAQPVILSGASPASLRARIDKLDREIKSPFTPHFVRVEKLNEITAAKRELQAIRQQGAEQQKQQILAMLPEGMSTERAGAYLRETPPDRWPDWAWKYEDATVNMLVRQKATPQEIKARTGRTVVKGIGSNSPPIVFPPGIDEAKAAEMILAVPDRNMMPERWMNDYLETRDDLMRTRWNRMNK